jgi:hypothetical protein
MISSAIIMKGRKVASAGYNLIQSLRNNGGIVKGRVIIFAYESYEALENTANVPNAYIPFNIPSRSKLPYRTELMRT